jgi:hypothetical protein
MGRMLNEAEPVPRLADTPRDRSGLPIPSLSDPNAADAHTDLVSLRATPAHERIGVRSRRLEFKTNRNNHHPWLDYDRGRGRAGRPPHENAPAVPPLAPPASGRGTERSHVIWDLFLRRAQRAAEDGCQFAM